MKSPADFIGKYLGHSEANTKGILASAMGKVLIIDEAYMLYSGTAGGGNQTDSFKSAIVDTIVAEVQSVPGEDRCVLLLGYEDKMVEMFQNVNPGLSRRYATPSFPMRLHQDHILQFGWLKILNPGIHSLQLLSYLLFRSCSISWQTHPARILIVIVSDWGIFLIKVDTSFLHMASAFEDSVRLLLYLFSICASFARGIPNPLPCPVVLDVYAKINQKFHADHRP